MHFHLLLGYLVGGHSNAQQKTVVFRSAQRSILRAKADVELLPLLGVMQQVLARALQCWWL